MMDVYAHLCVTLECQGAGFSACKVSKQWLFQQNFPYSVLQWCVVSTCKGNKQRREHRESKDSRDFEICFHFPCRTRRWRVPQSTRISWVLRIGRCSDETEQDVRRRRLRWNWLIRTEKECLRFCWTGIALKLCPKALLGASPLSGDTSKVEAALVAANRDEQSTEPMVPSISYILGETLDKSYSNLYNYI